MDDIYDDMNDYNKKRKRKVLNVFDDMIPHVLSNKKPQQVLKELFIRCRKLNNSLCFLNCTHYIIFILNNKRELQNIAINHSADINYKDFLKIYRDCTKSFFDY